MPWTPPIRFSPITRMRMRQFRRNRRAWASLLVLTSLYLLSLCAEGLCSNRFRYAPIPYGPDEIMKPADFEIYRRARLTLAPSSVPGRLNLKADGQITRAEGCAPFFPGIEAIDGEILTNHWIAPPALQEALEARLANRATPAQTFTLARRSDPAQRAVAALAAYEPRESPPSSVRLALRQDTDAGTGSTTFRITRNPASPDNAVRGPAESDWSIRPESAWRSLPEAIRTNLLACVRRSFDERSASETDLPGPHGPLRARCSLSDVSWPHRPVPGHWMGIDVAGRDVLVRVIYGLRTSLTFGLILVAWATLLGLCIGAVQGYFGGWVDIAGQRLVEVWSALPFLYVMVLIGAVLGRSFLLLLVCYGLFNWIGLSYYLRAEFLRLRNRPFVEAARCQGLSHARIIFRHILPNAVTPIVTLLPFQLVGAIAALAALDFLGFGLPPLTPSWGELLQQAQQCRWAWWLVLYPSAALFIVMFLAVLIGEGLRDAFDPKARTRLEG